MPITIGVVSQKGGVGKSSIARLIAREFAHHEWNVKIADMDIQQGTSFQWYKRRAANSISPEIRTETFATVKQALKDAENFDLFIMDGAPHATAATREIARAADIVLLPTGLAIDDLEPQVLLAHELVRDGVLAAKLAFVLWRVGDSQAEINDARDYISRAGYNTLGGEVPDRTGYRRASDAGHAATETKYHHLNERADAVAQSIINAINQVKDRRAA
jgi:chromosome partitioning protein